MEFKALFLLMVLLHSANCAARAYKCSGNYFGDEPISADCEEINIIGGNQDEASTSKIIRQQHGDVINLSNIPSSSYIHQNSRIVNPLTVATPSFIDKMNNYFEGGNQQDFLHFISRISAAYPFVFFRIFRVFLSKSGGTFRIITKPPPFGCRGAFRCR